MKSNNLGGFVQEIYLLGFMIRGTVKLMYSTGISCAFSTGFVFSSASVENNPAIESIDPKKTYFIINLL